jgi:hypothetical protein
MNSTNKEEMSATRPYETSNREDDPKGVVSGVGEVKVIEGYKVSKVKVGEVNDKVDEAKMQSSRSYLIVSIFTHAVLEELVNHDIALSSVKSRG